MARLWLTKEVIFEAYGGFTHVTATLDHWSSEDTKLFLLASPVGDAQVSYRRDRREATLVIPAGQKRSSDRPVAVQATDDVFRSPGSRKDVQVSRIVLDNFGVGADPAGARFTIIDDDAPRFLDCSVAYDFAAGVVASCFLPEAVFGNGELTYSISPDLGQDLAFYPGPSPRIGI